MRNVKAIERPRQLTLKTISVFLGIAKSVRAGAAHSRPATDIEHLSAHETASSIEQACETSFESPICRWWA